MVAEAVDSLALVFQDINFNSENLQEPEKIYTSDFVNQLINKLISLIEPNTANNIRVPAFDCLTNLLVASPPELIAKSRDLVKGMLAIIEDPDWRIRQRIYGYFLGLCQVRKDLFISDSDTIFPKLALCLNDPEPVAKRACFMVLWEFLTFHDDEQESAQVIQLLIPYFDSILPTLVQNAVLSEEDKVNMLLSVSRYIERNTLYDKDLTEEAGGDHFELNEEEDEVDVNGAYTLRKISMRCLIKIFEFMGNPAFSYIKTPLDTMLQSTDNLKKEAAICVLGTVGKHCFGELKNNLGLILQFVLTCCDAHDQFLKATSIWTICKFREHLLEDESENTKKFLHDYLNKILTTLQSSSLVAQDSAATALKKLCVSRAELITDFHPALLELFITLLTLQSHHKIFIYDTLSEFVDNLPDPEFQTVVLSKTIPLLQVQFNDVTLQDGAFIPLFECITSLVRVAKEKSMIFSEPLLNRVVLLAKDISKVIIQGKSVNHKSKDRINMEYELNSHLMRCFDFVGSLADATEGQFVRFPIVAEIPDIVYAHFNTENTFLKQIVYSLFGDLVAYCNPQLFQDKIDSAIKCMLLDCKLIPESLDPGRTYLSTTTNVLYCLSEIVIKFPSHIGPQEVLEKLLSIYQNSSKVGFY